MATKTLLSNVDLIRRFVFDNMPVTTDEIAAEVENEMASVRDIETARERYVLPVLNAQPYYKESGGKWKIVLDEMPEYKVLEEVMRDEKRLMYEREIRSRIAKKLGVKVATIVIDLTKVKYLMQQGSHYGLKDWTIANDQAEEVLSQHPGGLTETELFKLVCERFKLDPNNTILHLKGDKKKRFKQDRKQWMRKADYEAKQKQAKPAAAKLPDLKTGNIDLNLEGSFLEGLQTKPEESKMFESKGKGNLRKVLKKQAQDILESREDIAGKREDTASRLADVLTAAGVDESDIKSFQQVEAASRERSLSQKEREDIQQFIDQLMQLETVGVGASLQSVANAPLSVRKVHDVLALKYINYTRDRAMLASEYYRLLVDLIAPTLRSSVLHPASYDGEMAVELFNYLFDRLEGAAWTVEEEAGVLDVVQPDGSRYQLGKDDPALIEKARDRFIVSQVDLINYFVNYKFTGIETDKVLARAARVITRLSGYEDVYIVSRDYLAELPEVFGLPGNDENTIPHRFDCVIGNFTFVSDPNLAANYLDQSLQLLAQGGKLGVLVLDELLQLLKEHDLLEQFFDGFDVTHFVQLPIIEGRHKVVLLIAEGHSSSKEPGQPIITANIDDLKAANTLAHALMNQKQDGEESEAEEEAPKPYSLVIQSGLAGLIE